MGRDYYGLYRAVYTVTLELLIVSHITMIALSESLLSLLPPE